MSIFKTINIRYKWDEENFEKAFATSYTYQYKQSARRYIGWFFIAMAQFGVVAALKGGSIGLLMLSTILILYWYVIKKWLVHKRARAAFENSSLKNSIITLQITEEGLTQEDSLISWNDIQGVVPIEDDILLYQANHAFYIPASAFEAYEDKSHLKSLAKKKERYFDV